MGNIVKPGEVQIRQVSKNGPLVEPCVVRMETEGLIQFVTLGGLTKVEALAGQIAAGLLSSHNQPIEFPGLGFDAECDQLIAVRTISIAEAILAECQARAKEKQKNSQQSQ